MKEADYCQVSDLTRIRILQMVLGDLVPGCGHGAITQEEKVVVGSVLADWESRIREMMEKTYD